MQTLKLMSAVTFGVLLTACVTVNVYFPAAAAENAADRFIRDVYGRDSDEPGEAPPAGDEQSLILPAGDQPAYSGIAARLLGAIIPAAAAQEPDISIATPAINRLKSAMQSRHGALVPYYESGAIGMAANGLLTVRNAKAVPIRERNRVNQLVADENRDRNALYAEVARANGHPEWEPRIRSTFARRWVANAPSGWWFQSGGSWQQK